MSPPPEMTLRDWFAGQAAALLLERSVRHSMHALTSDQMLAAQAEDAYRLADALMKAREKKP